MPQLSPGEHECTVAVGERMRKYLVHVPRLAAPAAGWPLVICFHGGGSNPQQMIDFTGLSDAAEQHGFVVVYPAGTGIIQSALTWNAGICCGRAHRDKVDEIAFVNALLEDVARQLKIDPLRFYATGMSNGGMMAYLVADKLSHRFAAIAPVDGTIGSETCSPARPVPVVHFHGTHDEFVSYQGGIGRRSVSKTNFYSVEHSLAQWIRANDCNPAPLVETLPAQVEDGTRVSCYTYSPRGPGSDAEVVHYRIEGMGHTWPGRESRFKALGKVSRNLDATEVMWQFFAKHPMPAAIRKK